MLVKVEKKACKPKSICQAEPRWSAFLNSAREHASTTSLQRSRRPPANVRDVATYRQSRISTSESDSVESLNGTAVRLQDVHTLNLSGVAASSPFHASAVSIIAASVSMYVLSSDCEELP